MLLTEKNLQKDFEKEERKQRAYFLIKRAMLVFLILFAYLLLNRLLGFGIPCLFHKLTSLYCPGCGITRMFIALSKFDFQAAVEANVLAFLLLPFAGGIVFYKSVRFIKNGITDDSKLLKVCYGIALVLVVIFGVLRNMPGFSFFAPH